MIFYLVSTIIIIKEKRKCLMENTVQKEIDYDKWIESEKLHKDLCGSYDFCKYCNKSFHNLYEVKPLPPLYFS